ncbi:MAG: DUF3157 family protein [Spirochaetes bacterium]|nr:DUF3157 family protein [Spirochaetota bacterium]
MKKIILTLLFAFLTVSVLFGDIKAITADGRQVILMDDGTWEWAVDEETTEIYGYSKPEKSKANVKGKKIDYKIWYNSKIWKAKKKPGASEYSFEAKNSTMYGMVIPEKEYFDRDVLLEVALMNAKDASENVEVLEREERVVNGKKIIYMKMKAVIENLNFIYMGYYYSHEDFGSIQVIAYTLDSFLEAYENDMEDFLNGSEFLH